MTNSIEIYKIVHKPQQLFETKTIQTKMVHSKSLEADMKLILYGKTLILYGSKLKDLFTNHFSKSEIQINYSQTPCLGARFSCKWV